MSRSNTSSITGQLERFVATVHRRMMVLRGVERVGWCVLGGCAVSLILMPILIWRGQGVGELLAATFGLAGAAGVAWGIAARPTKLAAAIEADRQLKLADLLGTALMIRQQGGLDDALNASVLAIAEARCGQMSPSTVMLHRLGARGWGGIALAAALVGGVALFGGERNRAEAHVDRPLSWQDAERAADETNHTQFASAADMRRSAPGTGGDDDDDANNASRQSPDLQTDHNAGADGAAARSPNGASATESGNGAGASQSATKGHGDDTAPRGPIAGGTTKNPAPNGNSTPAGGTGAAASDDARAGGSGAGGTTTTAGGKHRHAAPVWQSDAWPADRQAARSALQNGHIPDAYRDLVRDYFERE